MKKSILILAAVPRLLWICVVAAALSGCVSKNTLVVGSKPFTESEIVGEMVAQLAERTGARVKRRFYMGGVILFEGLKSGEVDVYIEYTGTGLVSLLNEPAMTDPDKVYRRVRSEFKKRWNLDWLKPLGFNNTYAIVMRRDAAKKLGIRRISQLKRHREKLRCGFDLVFSDRPDGYPGMIVRYGEFCGSKTQMDPGIMYQALNGGEVDLISGYSTDGRIASLGLVVLEDDKKFFPPYHAAPLVGPAAFRKAPGLKAKLEALAGELSDPEITALNAEVDSKKRQVREVAREFLKRKGLL